MNPSDATISNRHSREVTARILGIKVRALHNLTVQGRIGHVKIGRTIGYTDAQILDCIQAHSRARRGPKALHAPVDYDLFLQSIRRLIAVQVDEALRERFSELEKAA